MLIFMPIFMLHDYLTIFSDDNISVGTAVFMNVINGLLHTVHNLDTALQIPVLSAQRLHLRRTEGQVWCKLGAGVDLHLQVKSPII